MQRRGWLLLIWICFLLRGGFYASMLPLWEGYDEFAHFGVIRAAALDGVWLAPRDQRGPCDVEASLDLVPIPWGVRTREVFRSGVTHEQFWSLPEAERRGRELRLRAIPRAWQWRESTRISAYEAYQPPVYYWLMAPVLFLLKGSSLLAQALVLRCISVVIASAAIPGAFAVSLAVVPRKSVALGCAALISVMPEFATNAARISNESVAILLFSLLVWIGLRLLAPNPDLKTALLLGTVLGLGLLTVFSGGRPAGPSASGLALSGNMETRGHIRRHCGGPLRLVVHSQRSDHRHFDWAGGTGGAARQVPEQPDGRHPACTLAPRHCRNGALASLFLRLERTHFAKLDVPRVFRHSGSCRGGRGDAVAPRTGPLAGRNLCVLLDG